VTVNFLTQGDPDTLDPQRISFAFAVNASIVRQVFEPLLRFDENLVPQPAAAESYQVSLDGTVYTFHLRQDGHWSDGQPVTAGQFAFSWKRLLDPALHADYAALFIDAGIVGVSAIDDYTLQIQLNQPFGALPDLAALWVGVPLRPEIVADDPDAWSQDPSTFVGNGPFMLNEWIHQDHLMLAPNPYYTAHLGWPKPTLSRVTITMGINPEGDFAAFVDNSSTRDWVLVPDVEVNRVLNDQLLAAESRQYNELTTFWVQMNGARAPLDNVLVRRALASSVDRVALVRDLATGVSRPVTSIIPPGMPGFQDGLGRELGFDPAGARALLAQAGFADGHGFPKLAFSFPDAPANLERARYLQAQWATTLGVDLQLTAMEAPAYQKALDTSSYDLAFGGWAGDYPDPQDWFSMVFGCKGAYNKFGYCNSGFDQLVARADMGGSLPDRLKLYAAAQSMLIQDVPVAPLFARGRLALVKPWVKAIDGGALIITPLDDYPGSLFLDKVQILRH
jgi:oligopeptide transport system substrate-binding protein